MSNLLAPLGTKVKHFKWGYTQCDELAAAGRGDSCFNKREPTDAERGELRTIPMNCRFCENEDEAVKERAILNFGKLGQTAEENIKALTE
ncbi:uncharacterized protein EAF02_011379 [Botrytis sinoallii]|uniref:uncharacterized protein n=1 Tax=Botrytis sinoallii TaxID=1463999 RepID=UPI001901375C|nr:uncharacterized protein EAF02_011379 [Botrytis sinoallii]KAF7857146.1 hypothetical protein EAF02_011379 [Botrytis sinoallii]